MLGWNNALWIVIRSRVPVTIQSEWITWAQRNYAKQTFVMTSAPGYGNFYNAAGKDNSS